MIQMIQRILPHNPSRRTVANRPRVEIIRRWVETADERCPLACVWFALPEIIPDQDDESESPRPAFSSFRLKAGRLHPINNLPAPSILVQSLKNSIHTIAAILLLVNPTPALFVIGAATLLLLFSSIHNAWDTVTYVAIELSQPENTNQD